MNINAKLLRKQLRFLYELQAKTKLPKNRQMIDGITNLLEAIQDQIDLPSVTLKMKGK